MKDYTLTNTRPSRAQTILSILGILFIAANLRPAITSVGPLINTMSAEMGLSSGQAGLLTTLPLIAFAVLSAQAPRISRKIGIEWTLFAGLVTLIVGFLIRFLPSVVLLFVGTALIGMGIAACNVILPGLIKQKFPDKVGMMTGTYSTAMGFCASFASGLSIPLAKGLGLGWRGALACWIILAVVAGVVWLPQLRARHKAVRGKSSFAELFRSPLAWQVTIFMGLQSFSFYVMVTWLPEILHNGGMSVTASGWMLSIFQFVGLPFTLFVPIFADRLPNQRPIIAGIGVCYFIGVIGFIYGGGIFLLTVWTILLGIAQGASISLSLSFLGMRAANARQAAELSGMAQSIGYLLAAIGPTLIGFLRDATNTWTIPLVTLLVTGIILFIAGFGAARDKVISDK